MVHECDVTQTKFSPNFLSNETIVCRTGLYPVCVVFMETFGIILFTKHELTETNPGGLRRKPAAIRVALGVDIAHFAVQHTVQGTNTEGGAGERGREGSR